MSHQKAPSASKNVTPSVVPPPFKGRSGGENLVFRRGWQDSQPLPGWEDAKVAFEVQVFEVSLGARRAHLGQGGDDRLRGVRGGSSRRVGHSDAGGTSRALLPRPPRRGGGRDLCTAGFRRHARRPIATSETGLRNKSGPRCPARAVCASSPLGGDLVR
jgi:hypothetical protein